MSRAVKHIKLDNAKIRADPVEVETSDLDIKMGDAKELDKSEKHEEALAKCVCWRPHPSIQQNPRFCTCEQKDVLCPPFNTGPGPKHDLGSDYVARPERKR